MHRLVRNIVILAFFLATSLSASAQTVDALIEKLVAARGGREKIDAIRSVEMTITTNMMGRDLPGKIYLKRPGKVRTELSAQGKTMIRAYDGKVAWLIMPFHGGSSDPQTVPPEEMQSLVEQADIDGPLVDYKTKGNRVEVMGKEEVAGSPAWKLKLTRKDGDVAFVYLDAESGLRVRQTSKQHQQGTIVEVDSYFTNYKPAGGVLFPFSIDNRVGGQAVGPVTVHEIKVNGPIDDAIFERPRPTAAAAGGKAN